MFHVRRELPHAPNISTSPDKTATRICFIAGFRLQTAIFYAGAGASSKRKRPSVAAQFEFPHERAAVSLQGATDYSGCSEKRTARELAGSSTGTILARRVWPGLDRFCVASITLMVGVYHSRKQSTRSSHPRNWVSGSRRSNRTF
jgi:hypothetical protein